MKASEFFSKLANTIEKNGDFDIDIEMSNTANNNYGNEFVDLGLPSGTLWAKCNYGANKETESGELYKWDEAMKLPILLPTKEQFEELIENTTSEWIYNYRRSGVNGRVFTSKINSNSIFIPASGRTNGGSVFYRGSSGYVWSSRLYSSDPYYALSLYFDSSDMGVYGYYRCNSRSVRGVISNF